MDAQWIFIGLYSIVTLLYGSIFTMLFLNIRWDNRKNILIFILYLLFSLGVQGIIVYCNSAAMVEKWYPLIVHVPLFLVCTTYYRKSILTTGSAIMLSYFLTSPRYVLTEIIIILFPMLPCAEYVGKMLASVFLTYPIYQWMVPVVRRSFKRSSKDVMHFFVPLIIVYTLSYLLYVYTNLLSTNGIVMLEIVFTLFFLIILYYMQKYFVSIDDIIEKENRNNVLRLSAEALKKQLDVLNESNEHTRILRHDIRHYATMVKRYAELGDMEKVMQISEEIELKNNAVMVKNYCSNSWINILLNNYISQLEDIGVHPKLEISVPMEFPFNVMDLCVILGNILDNAVRSITLCKEKRDCSILLRHDSGKLYLEVQNSCEVPVSFQAGIPLSLRDGHGYGCKSIVYITEKYHGICSFELREARFVTQVILHEK